jgi:hypothetical protein
MPNPTAPQVVSVYPYDSYDFGGGLPVITRLGVTVSTQPNIDNLIIAAAAANVSLYFGAVPGTGNANFNINTAAQTLSRAQQLQVAANLGLGLGKVTAVPFAATLNINTDNTEFANVAQLTGAVTVAAPTGTPADGQILIFRFIQDATGRVITWNAIFAFGTDFPSANVPATANAKFEVGFRYNATDSKWRCFHIARGF